MFRRVFAVLALSTLLAGCGGGGGGNNEATGVDQAALGPLAGATIRAYQLADLTEPVEGPITANSSQTDLSVAGSFQLTLEGIPDDEWILVAASGGTDIDANDDGVLDSSPTPNNGVAYALARAADWRRGKVTINPITDIIYRTLKEQGAVTANNEELLVLLDEMSKNFVGDVTDDGYFNYSDVIHLVPRVDKAFSIIGWQTILKNYVKRIHAGAPSSELSERADLLRLTQRGDEVTTNASGDGIQKVEQLASETVETEIKASSNDKVSMLEQRYLSSTGALVTVSALNTSVDSGRARVEVRYNGHTLVFEGYSSVLQNAVFSESGISILPSQLVAVEKSGDDGLTIRLDKHLTQMLSDNSLALTIDGRRPNSDEWEVLQDDPLLEWRWSVSDQLDSSAVLASASLDNGVAARLRTDGTMVVAMPLAKYDEMLGISETGEALARSNWKGLLVDSVSAIASAATATVCSASSVVTGPAGLACGAVAALDAYSKVSDAEMLFDMTAYFREVTWTSTRAGLFGRFADGAGTPYTIVPGENYYAVVFIRSRKKEVLDIDLTASYDTQYQNYGMDSGWKYNVLRRPVQNLSVGKDKGYMVVLPRTVSFAKNGGGLVFGHEVLVGDKPVQLKAVTKADLRRNVASSYGFSSDGGRIFTDFVYAQDGDNLVFDASPSEPIAGTSYKWRNADGAIVGAGKQVSLSGADVTANEHGHPITLETENSLLGRQGARTHYVVFSSAGPDQGSKELGGMPVAYYPLDTDANDDSGNGNDGIVYGAVRFLGGVVGGAANVDNGPTSDTFYTNEYIELPNTSLTNLTVSHWVKWDSIATAPDGNAGVTYSLGSQTLGERGFQITVKEDGTVAPQLRYDGYGAHTKAFDVSDHQWHMLTVVVDAAKLSFYVDGSLFDSTGVTFGHSFSDAPQFIALHEWYNNSARASRYDGAVDEVRIYDRALTAQGVASLY